MHDNHARAAWQVPDVPDLHYANGLLGAIRGGVEGARCQLRGSDVVVRLEVTMLDGDIF
jgi:hypothetical protein